MAINNFCQIGKQITISLQNLIFWKEKIEGTKVNSRKIQNSKYNKKYQVGI